MIFSEKFFDNIHLANQHSLLGKKAVDELLQFFRQLCSTEETHAKNLETLSNFQFLLLRGSTYEACQGLKLDILKTSKEIKVFISNIQDDLIRPLQIISSSIQESSKSLFSESSKIMKQKDLYIEKLTRCREKFFKSCSECEKITNNLEQPQTQAQRERYLQKLIKHKNQLDVDLKSYEDQINSWPDFMNSYKPAVSPILAAYEKIEFNRLMGIKDQLRKFVVYEASYIRNVQYEIDGLAKTMEDIQVEHDLIMCCPQGVPWTQPEFEPYRGTHPSFKLINLNGLSIPIPLPIQEPKWSEIVFQGSIEEMYKTEIDIITLKATQGHELSSEDFVQFNSLIKDSLGRRAWVWSMNMKKVEPLLSDKGYIHLGELMLSVLNEVIPI